MSLKISFITLFPEIYESVLNTSLLARAQQNGAVSYEIFHLRDYTEDRHRTVDRRPYGGGPGMVLAVDVLYRAWQAAQQEGRNKGYPQGYTILLTPQGRVFRQERAENLAESTHLILVAAHYEGVDERFIELCVDEELSLGDYVLTGGELAALVVTDCLVRLLPDVVGNQESVRDETFTQNGLLKYPQYTRPRLFQGKEVPEVLLSGDHEKIRVWREHQRFQQTAKKRPDLYQENEGNEKNEGNEDPGPRKENP